MSCVQKIIALVGLPASGKTTLAEKIIKDNPQEVYFLIDDPLLVEEKKKLPDILQDILLHPKNYNHPQTLLISSVHFCQKEFQEKLSSFCIEQFHFHPQFIYFENNVQKALSNAHARNESLFLEGKPIKKVEQLIKAYGSIYQPERVDVLIHTPSKTEKHKI